MLPGEIRIFLLGLIAGCCLVNGQNFTTTYKCLFQSPLQYKFVMSSGCINIPEKPTCANKNDIYTVGIGCFEEYSRADCIGPYIRTQSNPLGFRGTNLNIIRSVRSCEDTDRSLTVNPVRVKLYANANYKVVLEDYLLTEPTQCRNLLSVHRKRVSSAKLPYCVIFYANENCRDSSIYPQIRLEKGEYRSFQDFYFDDSTISYKACNPEDVLRKSELNAKVVKFEVFLNPAEVRQKSRSVRSEMAAKTTFVNNGSATLTQKYEVEKSFSESIEINRSETVSRMNKVSVSSTVSIEFSAGIPGIVSGKSSASLTAGYEFTQSSAKTEGVKYTDVKSKKFLISQNIQVPSCSSYEVSSFVLSTENYPLRYITHLEISGGYLDGPKFTASQVRQRLGRDMTYVRTVDSNTILAKTENTIMMDYAWEAVFSGEGAVIPGCKEINPSKAGLSKSGVLPLGKVETSFAENGMQVQVNGTGLTV